LAGDIPVAKRETVYELAGRQCGAGWSDIIQPLCGELQRLGGTVKQIKEKFGQLRFVYSLPATVSDTKRRAFRRRVDQAEEASRGICETYGKLGKLITERGFPLFTACDACGEARRALYR